MISPDGDITVTNDGATIMGQMQVCLRLLSTPLTGSTPFLTRYTAVTRLNTKLRNSWSSCRNLKTTKSETELPALSVRPPLDPHRAHLVIDPLSNAQSSPVPSSNLPPLSSTAEFTRLRSQTDSTRRAQSPFRSSTASETRSISRSTTRLNC